MRETFLPFAVPSLGEAEISSVVDTLRSNWLTTGPKTRQFEKAFAATIGAEASLALNSGTAAMHVALAAMGIGPGSVVYTTPMTFCSTVHVIEQVGATPILVDVEADTLNIDPSRLQEAMATRKTGGRVVPAVQGFDAILPVHFAGHPCEMDAIVEAAATGGLALIEDAAHALPARYRGQAIGGVPHGSGGPERCVAFSFYVTKNMTTGEGGMLVGSQALMDVARPWSLHGMSGGAWNRYNAEAPWFYEVTCAGFKYNMTDIQAAIGIEQLKQINDFHARRKEIACRYSAAFSQMESLQVPVERTWVDSAWHLYVLRLVDSQLTIDRNRFVRELSGRNIGSSVHFIPIHLHRYYRDRYGWKPQNFPVALKNFERMLSLPMHPALGDDDVDDVIEAVTDIVRMYQR